MSDALDTVVEFMSEYIPEGSVLTIEETDNKYCFKYIYRIRYISKNSKRTMVMVAKGNDLPDSANGLMHFYLRQMVLTQEEINAEFSKLARKENIAKRDAWLSMGKKSRAKDGKGDLFSIIDKEAQKDIIATGSYMGAMVDRT